MIAAIVAVDEKWGIGKNGDLLFHIPEDLRFFQRITRNNAVIMGRKTWDSLPAKPLINRLNIVVTTGEEGIRNNALFVGLSDAMSILINAKDTDDYYVIGGETIYKELLLFCEVIYVTKIFSDGQADRFFPDIDKDNKWIFWDSTSKKEYEGVKYQFFEYRRNKECQ